MTATGPEPPEGVDPVAPATPGVPADPAVTGDPPPARYEAQRFDSLTDEELDAAIRHLEDVKASRRATGQATQVEHETGGGE